MRQRLEHTAERGYGVPAFDLSNLKQVQAIMEARHETDRPVIMQPCAGARNCANETFPKHLSEAPIEAYPHRPIVVQVASQDRPNGAPLGIGRVKPLSAGAVQPGSLPASPECAAQLRPRAPGHR